MIKKQIGTVVRKRLGAVRKKTVLMGGNALKQYETVRLPKDKYAEQCRRFMLRFNLAFGFFPYLIKAYHTKEDFGDADWLVSADMLPENWIDKLKSTFLLSPEQIVKNSNVVSIGLNNFQHDLIVTPDAEMEMAKFYFSYNDFGNLIGRIGHKLGIKIGHDSLWLVVRKDTHILANIQLTSVPSKILEVLGLDVKRYQEGFETLEDMFNYVASSKYFDPEIYSLEHRSNTSCVRDRKRSTYNKFLRWVEETKPKANHNFKNKSEHGGYSIREEYFQEAVLNYFPWVKDEVDAVIDEYELNEKFKTVYNGELVGEWTGYTGKQLGAFMFIIGSEITRIRKLQWLDDPRMSKHFVTQRWAENGGVMFMRSPRTPEEEQELKNQAQEVYDRMARISK